MSCDRIHAGASYPQNLAADHHVSRSVSPRVQGIHAVETGITVRAIETITLTVRGEVTITMIQPVKSALERLPRALVANPTGAS